jgi:hypothetical protein
MKLITANVNEEDIAKVREMSEKDGLNFSALVRAMIRDRYDEYRRRREQ